MCSLIGFGNCSRYYIYILISDLARFLKEDILGVGVEKQIIVDLRLVFHPFIILLIGFAADFIFSIIVWCIFNYREKKNEKMNNKLPVMENEKELSKTNSNDKTFELRNSSISDLPINGDGNESRKSPNFNRDSSLKYYLIHNELATEDDLIKKSAQKFIILSTILIVIKEFANKILYSYDDIFNFYFVNLIIIAIIWKRFYKKRLYKHHILSIISVSVVSLSCLIIFILIMIFGRSRNYSNNRGNNRPNDGKTNNSNNFMNGFYLNIVLFLVFLIISTCFCTGIIFQKNLMQFQFIPSYKFLFYKGIFGISFCIIALIFSTNFSCSNYLDQNSNSSNPELNLSRSFNPVRCRDLYDDKFYLDNFYSYFNNNITEVPNNTTAEIFISIGYFGLNFISDYSIILVNKFLTPFHVLITESFYSLMHIVSQYAIKFSYEDEQTGNNRGNKSRRERFYNIFFTQPKFISVKFVSIFFEFIGYLIYMEIIQLNFCGLNRDISRNIKKRAELDAIISNKELEGDSEDIMNDSLK